MSKKGILIICMILAMATWAVSEIAHLPLKDGEGRLGDTDKHWGLAYIDDIFLDAVTLDQALTGSASSPSLAFGDGDTGFFESADDTLRATFGGTLSYTWTASAFNDTTSGSWQLIGTAATATAPVFSFNNDLDTGLGRAGDDQLSLIAGSVEMQRLTEGADSFISYHGTDSSDTPQAGLTGGLKYYGYAIALTDAAEDNTCTLGGTGVADCFVLPNPTSQGRLKLHTSGAEFGSYIVSKLGVTVEADGDADSTNMEFNVANVAACADAKVCVFDYGRALTLDSLAEDTCSGSGGSDCDGVYTGVTTTAASAGTGVILTITIESDLITDWVITSGGLSYVVDETLTLDGLVSAGCTECDDDATLDILTEGHVGIQNNIAAETTVMVQFWFD